LLVGLGSVKLLKTLFTGIGGIVCSTFLFFLPRGFFPRLFFNAKPSSISDKQFSALQPPVFPEFLLPPAP
jgi:hypothetical protein